MMLEETLDERSVCRVRRMRDLFDSRGSGVELDETHFHDCRVGYRHCLPLEPFAIARVGLIYGNLCCVHEGRQGRYSQSSTLAAEVCGSSDLFLWIQPATFQRRDGSSTYRMSMSTARSYKAPRREMEGGAHEFHIGQQISASSSFCMLQARSQSTREGLRMSSGRDFQ
ncbi:hypothetical protein IQ06DRAFT_49103 [Phaeosphaeriaceae sp. SRC1lsM3a]|nr:hypothetical protein IQ06DRAFT_49103 [Stagonospora sp. SRC1lsM3a]